EDWSALLPGVAACPAVRTRIGIHLGEVGRMEMAGREDVVGLAADLAARIMSLALPSQVLMTRSASDDARQFIAREASGDESSTLQWRAWGDYLFKGAEEPMEVFEAGFPRISPLTAPPSSDKAKRIVPNEVEELLGWRPAAGQEI